jgi:hypothetical protein
LLSFPYSPSFPFFYFPFLLSHPISSCPILSYSLLSCPVVSYLILSYPVLFCFILSCLPRMEMSVRTLDWSHYFFIPVPFRLQQANPFHDTSLNTTSVSLNPVPFSIAPPLMLCTYIHYISIYLSTFPTIGIPDGLLPAGKLRTLNKAPLTARISCRKRVASSTLSSLSSALDFLEGSLSLLLLLLVLMLPYRMWWSV